MIKTKRVSDHVVLVSAPQEELCRAFMRLQEHYEGAEFRGRIFTEGQFLSWYAEHSDSGAATYHRDVMGFNIPSSVLEPFVKGLFDPLTPLEAELVALLRHRTDRFYVIGVPEGGEAPTGGLSALEHEICHALFYTDEAYRKACQKIIDGSRAKLRPITDYLASRLYHPAVFDDECHAFISADLEWLIEKRGVDAAHLRPVQRALRAVRARHPVGSEAKTSASPQTSTTKKFQANKNRKGRKTRGRS